MDNIIDQRHTALNNNPSDNNFLSPLNFKFMLHRAPNLNFFIQKVDFPSITIAPIRQATPFADIWQPGDNIDYTPLTVVFRVDEDMNNYFEILRWALALGEEESFKAYARLKAHPEWTGHGIKSDIVLSVLDSARLPNLHFYFHDAFPFFLSNMTFQTTPNSIPFQVATASFRYTEYDVERVKKA